MYLPLLFQFKILLNLQKVSQNSVTARKIVITTEKNVATMKKYLFDNAD